MFNKKLITSVLIVLVVLVGVKPFNYTVAGVKQYIKIELKVMNTAFNISHTVLKNVKIVGYKIVNVKNEGSDSYYTELENIKNIGGK